MKNIIGKILAKFINRWNINLDFVVSKNIKVTQNIDVIKEIGIEWKKIDISYWIKKENDEYLLSQVGMSLSESLHIAEKIRKNISSVSVNSENGIIDVRLEYDEELSDFFDIS